MFVVAYTGYGWGCLWAFADVLLALSSFEARTRLAAFAQTWRARIPKTAATLERDARADHYLLRAGRGGTPTRPHHLLAGAHQSRVAAQVSPSLLLWQSKGG
jgi:hypothetical protein